MRTNRNARNNHAITIDLPEAVLREIERLARQRGENVEAFVADVVARHAVAEQEAAAFFAERAARAKPGAAECFLREQAGDEPPRPGDEMD